MPPPLPDAVHQRVLTLRQTHSLREVAALVGLPLGTVKTICTRSGTFRENEALRSLMTLPPVQHSASTAVAITPELPPQQNITGHVDLDAVLWLRAVIDTGDAGHIAQVLLVANRIKTPAGELERLYMDYLLQVTGNEMRAVFGSLNIANIKHHAQSTIEKQHAQAAALSRFGTVDALFAPTPAEEFCTMVLAGVKPGPHFFLDAAEAAERFKAHPELLPRTLSDVLHELAYWSSLYQARALFGCGDPVPEVSAREDFVFALMAHLRPRTKDEAVQVLRYLADSERMDRAETQAILENLVGGGRA